jgi:hypothetical protein
MADAESLTVSSETQLYSELVLDLYISNSFASLLYLKDFLASETCVAEPHGFQNTSIMPGERQVRFSICVFMALVALIGL